MIWKETDWGQLKSRHYNARGLGFADFFPDRHKRKMMKLAGITQSDVFYDLGCGDASVLIFAVNEFGARKAVGFENDPTRNSIARQRVRSEGLSDRISIERDMHEADLSKADVILSMIQEYEESYRYLLKHGIRDGTRLIKHDLPLVGFDFDAMDFPFYLVRFPLKKSSSPEHWAAKVMGEAKASVQDVWHELYHYQYEKGYTKWDIRRFERILKNRFNH